MSEWVHHAINKIEADMQRSSDTHLIPLSLPACSGIELYFKDESTHPTGSLKHRLARSLFLYGLCNGAIRQDTTIVEASSGSTAISEAYFARLLGLKFIAVIPEQTSVEKVREIEFYGGHCHRVKGCDIYTAAEALASQENGVYLDQFTNAERATDWRGNNNIAESIFKQMALENHPEPSWIVVGAGTGGTSATIGRYLRYRAHQTKLCVADPENSVFFDYFHSRDKQLSITQSSRIEGIGRPRVEPSFVPNVVDHMIQVPDAASFAAIHFLKTQLNRRCGGSTGTNLIAALELIADMKASGQQGSIVTMICDSGERYADTYYDPDWLRAQGFESDIERHRQRIDDFMSSGAWARLQ